MAARLALALLEKPWPDILTLVEVTRVESPVDVVRDGVPEALAAKAGRYVFQRLGLDRA
jgi:hypothetical protein